MNTSCALVGLGLPERLALGGSKGAAALFNDGAGHRVAGHPDAHGVQTGTALRCHLRAAGHNDGERAGAERSHQQLGALRHLADKAGQHFRSGDMDDQGIVLRAALGHKDLLHSLAVAGIGSNAVNRLGGQGHQLTVLQQGSGFFNAFFSSDAGKISVFISIRIIVLSICKVFMLFSIYRQDIVLFSKPHFSPAR